jgi:hypothetical protein
VSEIVRAPIKVMPRMPRMSCKDIPDAPILRFLAALNGRWANCFGAEFANSVTHAMPPGTPERLAYAKMASLIRRGLVDGCPVYRTRGDYILTAAGRAAITEPSP